MVVREKASAEKSAQKPATARELAQAIRATGLVGMWKDRTDMGGSREFARRLRNLAEKRQPTD